MSNVRAHLQNDLARVKDSCTWAHFPRTCAVERPQSSGVIFADFYLNLEWGADRISREPNYYTDLPYKLHISDEYCEHGKSVSTQLREMGGFLDSAFYQNDPWLLCNLCDMKLAFLGVPTGKIFYVARPGGDSKGLVSCLEKGAMGDTNSAFLDPSAMCSVEEFRKSAHFAIGEANIVCAEGRSDSRFAGDLWDRFVAAEPCGLMSNFGQASQVSSKGRKPNIPTTATSL